MDKKRLLHELSAMLGTDEPEVDLTTLSDEDLLREYAREASGEAEVARERASAESADPVFGYLQGLSDDALLAEYHEATAAVAAQEAEAERRRPKPVLLPVPVAEPPVEPHPVELVEPTPTVATPTLTARQEWDAKQARMMREDVDEATADGELEARARGRDDARPSTYDGPMLGELLRGG